MSAPVEALRAGDGRPPEPEPRVRGERILRALDRGWTFAEQGLERLLPGPLNPLAEAGAIANVSLLLALVSGVLLLFWYVPNVHEAFASVEAMAQSPWSAGLMRSVHRYSSDAAVLFAALHGLRLFLARRFTGPRWLAWVTGLGAVAVTVVIGWLGYWLVWDARARQVAVGTARLLDALPIFADPLSRSFLTDQRLNSLLFFVVFFVHMLIPLVLGLLLWLHIARLERPRFLTGRALGAAVVIATLALSLIAPATSAAPAQLAFLPEGFTRDLWYLLPLSLTDRLSSGALWALILVGTLALLSAPWSLARERVRVAKVIESRCQGCRLCSLDCPYDAIAMVPRAPDQNPLAHIAAGPAEIKPAGGENRTHDLSIVARVDSSVCVGCGICAGSCDSAAIGLEWFKALDSRKRLDRALDPVGAPSAVAFVCASSGAARAGELEGFVVETVPCVGWLHPLSIERAVRHGAKDVAVVACGGCRFREGAAHTVARMTGAREPALRSEKVRPEQLHLVSADTPAELRAAAARIRAGAPAEPRPLGPAPRAVAGLAVALLASALVWVGSDWPYTVPGDARPQLVVSFLHAAQSAERCRPPTAEEKASRPIHMQAAQICERGRPPVRLQVWVDGELVHDHAYPPGGLWSDGASVAVARLPLEPGSHRVELALDDTGEGTFTHRDARTLEVVERERAVVVFEAGGFVWAEE